MVVHCDELILQIKCDLVLAHCVCVCGGGGGGGERGMRVVLVGCVWCKIKNPVPLYIRT